MDVIDILVTYRASFLRGLGVTLELCLIIWTAGLLIGSLLGVVESRWQVAVGIPFRLISFTLSGVPILVFLFWLHYPLQAMLGVVIPPFYTAALALSIVNVFAVADLVRHVMTDFPTEYLAAARVCGLSPSKTLFHIQLPIVLRQVIPGLLMIQVNMLQATLFASLISVDEVFRMAQRINAQVYKPVEIYTALAVLFLAICLPLNALAIWLKHRFTRNISDR
jgi:polar amino acid transport system permease protein